MAEFKPLEHTVAVMIREFNGGTSKHRTASDLAKAIISEVRNYEHNAETVRNAIASVMMKGSV